MSIIIVGGGIAGFATSFEISKTLPFLSQTIIEAKNDIGGRAYSTDQGIDLGGTWIWNDNNTTLSLISELASSGLEVFPHPGTFDTVRVSGGLNQLVQCLKKGIMKNGNAIHVEVNSRVTQIEILENSCQVTTERNCYTADLVIVAVPPRIVARQITFIPSLPLQKKQVMISQNTWMAAMMKIALVFDEPWWRNDVMFFNRRFRNGVWQVVDASTINDSLFVLVLFVKPPNFDMDHTMMIDLNLNLKDKTGVWVNSIIQQISFGNSPKKVILRSWRHDSNFFDTDGIKEKDDMSYMIHPSDGGSLLRDPLCDSKMIPRVFFAGSETDVQYPGFIEGAVRSAKRVAREVISNINSDIKKTN